MGESVNMNKRQGNIKITNCDKYLSKNIRPLSLPLVKGDGVTVTDINSKKYLDFSSQTLNMNLGHCHPRIVNAVKGQLDRIYYTSSRFLHPSALLLAKRLVEIAPHGLTKVNLKITSGSEANEGAIKMVRKYHNKNTIASVYLSFFGVTFETMRCSGKYFNTSFLGDRGNYMHISPPYCFRCVYNKNPSDCSLECATEFEKILQYRDDIGGFMIEPIMVDTGGVIICPKEYLKKIRKICNEHDIALIFDEDQTSFGWLGEMFASDYFGVVPDIMTFGKGLAAGFPLSAVLFKKKYDVLEYGEHEFTHGAHPISCVAALENIKILTENDFLNDVKTKAKYFENRLIEIQEKIEWIDVRTIGLIAGVEILTDKKTPDPIKARKIFDDCLKNGVIFRLSHDFNGNVIIIKPPLIVTNYEIDKALDVLLQVLMKHNK